MSCIARCLGAPDKVPAGKVSAIAWTEEPSEKVLSFVLNHGLGTSYGDYINERRVADAQRRLADPAYAHLSVLAVGLDAGFASKSTFNRVFKERAGETPSAYRARVIAA